jgi:hypothetical protein
MKKGIRNVLSGIIVWLLNPVVFLTFFGPLLTVVAMRLIQSDGFQATDPILAEDFKSLFGHKAMPGLVDYTAQYYTALLVSVFWLRSCFEKGLVDCALNFARSNNSAANPSTSGESPGEILLLILTVSGVFILIGLAYAILSGIMATPEVLKIYMNHTPRLGVFKFPPIASPITWVRIIVGVHGICLIFYKPK